MPARGGPLVSVTVPPRELARLERLVTVIEGIGDKDLKKELASGLRRSATPIRRELKRAALGRLPYRGGLAETVTAGMRFRTSVSVGVNPRMRINASLPGHDLAALNRGRIRHPVYGHEDRWVNQYEPGARGWWDDGAVFGQQDALEQISDAIDRVARKAKARL